MELNNSQTPILLHVFHSATVSGPETLVLPALARIGIPVQVVFLTESRLGEVARRPMLYARRLGLEVIEVPVRSRLDRHAISDLARVFTGANPRWIHAHDVKASFYTLLAARDIRATSTLCSTHHGIQGRPDLTSRLYERLYSHLILPRFDRVIAVSEADYRELVRRGIPQDKLRLHPNGVTRRKVTSTERAAVRQSIQSNWGLPPENASVFSFGYVGRLSHEKRPDRVLKLIHELDQRVPDPSWQLLIFGSGKLEPEMRKLATTLRIENRVRWMGYRENLGNEMAGIDLLLSLSDAEGMPISMIEAAWAGTPVYSTAVGGVNDLIVNDVDGWTVPVDRPEHVMAEELAAHLLSPSSVSGAGKVFQAKVAARFSEEAWLENLKKLYIANPAPGASRT